MYILRLQCEDQPGIVARVAGLLHDTGCNIEASAQYHDPYSRQFFMRVVFSAATNEAYDFFVKRFESMIADLDMQASIDPKGQSIKTLIMVSKEDHCLNDLLYRWRTKALNIDICGVVSNHETSRQLVEERGLSFHYLPMTPENKSEQEQVLRGLIDQTDAELIVLARYMQILSDRFCQDYPQRIINIHHSFLPGFKGAKPYHQAFERGVKIIGATAHFVTGDLDEGPIIAQNILPIDHSYTPSDLQSAGRDTEARTLSRAVDLYTQRRIFMVGRRTVIL